MDMVKYSADEAAGKLSLGPRESGMVSTGRPAVCPEMLEVGVYVFFRRVGGRH